MKFILKYYYMQSAHMHTHTHAHTHTQSFYGSSGFGAGLPRWASTRKVKPGR